MYTSEKYQAKLLGTIRNPHRVNSERSFHIEKLSSYLSNYVKMSVCDNTCHF